MIVVKVGGGKNIDLDVVCDDVARMVDEGQQIVLVHGGAQLTNEVAEALGHQPTFVTSPSGYSSRLTDRRTMEIFQMVYCGQINKGIVERLQQRGQNALGLSGMDGRLWEGSRKRAIRAVENGRQRIIRDSLTGRVERVNVDLLHTLLDAGYLPVLTAPAISYDGEAINVDGDRAAAITAVSMEAAELLILSDVPGVLADFPYEESLLHTIEVDEIEAVAQSYAQGRMRIKLLAAREALSGGVRRVTIASACVARPIYNALAGSGTVIGRDVGQQQSATEVGA